MRLTRRVSITGALLVVLAVVAGCTARQQASPGTGPVTTLAPIATAAPDATPRPSLAACGQPAAPSASPAPGASPASSDVITPLTGFPADNAYEVTAATYSPAGFVAVGFGARPGEDYFGVRQGIVWTSCDGLTWQQLVDPSFEFVTPSHIVALGSDLYVIGALATCPDFVEDECQDVAEAGNIILRSSAGGAWQRLPQDPAIQHAFIEGAVAVNGRLAVYGTADDENLSSTLWLSPDGTTWTPTTQLAGMDPITALTEQGSGMLAFGNEFVDELEDTRLVAATSGDGLSFSVVTAPELLGGTIESVAAGPAGYVGVGVGYPEGSDFALRAIALYSPDGQTWTETDAADGSFDDSSLDRVHPLPNGYVATGSTIDELDFTIQTGRLWLSPDGRAWRSLGEYGNSTTAFMVSALGAPGLVVFTADQTETDEGDVISTIGAYFAPIAGLTP